MMMMTTTTTLSHHPFPFSYFKNIFVVKHILCIRYNMVYSGLVYVTTYNMVYSGLYEFNEYNPL